MRDERGMEMDIFGLCEGILIDDPAIDDLDDDLNEGYGSQDAPVEELMESGRACEVGGMESWKPA
jgi:hypothetical protein